MAFVAVARADKLPAERGLQVQAAGRSIALFRVEAGVFAIDAKCPHRGAPLAQGKCIGEILTCPWHDARFELSSGKVLCGPATTGVASYPTEIRGKRVFVDLPGAQRRWWHWLLGR